MNNEGNMNNQYNNQNNYTSSINNANGQVNQSGIITNFDNNTPITNQPKTNELTNTTKEVATGILNIIMSRYAAYIGALMMLFGIAAYIFSNPNNYGIHVFSIIILIIGIIMIIIGVKAKIKFLSLRHTNSVVGGYYKIKRIIGLIFGIIAVTILLIQYLKK